MMQWKSQVSSNSNLESALAEAVAALLASLPGSPPDLLVAFPSGYPPEDTLHLPKLLSEKLPHRFLFGCTAGGVIGGGEEIERRTALSLSAAWMPEVELCAFHLPAEGIPLPEADAGAWEKAV